MSISDDPQPPRRLLVVERVSWAQRDIHAHSDDTAVRPQADQYSTQCRMITWNVVIQYTETLSDQIVSNIRQSMLRQKFRRTI